MKRPTKTDTTRGHLDGLLLACLEGGPAHGYRLIELLGERSEGRFTLPEGTVYPALHRLEARGLVASEWSAHAGRRRRIYRLTAAGARALAAERAEWRVFAGALSAVLGGAA